MEVVTVDSSLAGHDASSLLLHDVPSPISLRELIRLCVREEVAAHNANPNQAEKLGWEEQAERAIAAFGRNGYFVFIGERQVDMLDEELTLDASEVVRFVRVFPLVGG